MTTATSIDPSLELQRQELAELIRRHAGEPHGPASAIDDLYLVCLLYTSPSPRDRQKSRMPSSA